MQPTSQDRGRRKPYYAASRLRQYCWWHDHGRTPALSEWISTHATESASKKIWSTSTLANYFAASDVPTDKSDCIFGKLTLWQC